MMPTTGYLISGLFIAILTGPSCVNVSLLLPFVFVMRNGAVALLWPSLPPSLPRMAVRGSDSDLSLSLSLSLSPSLSLPLSSHDVSATQQFS